MRGDGMLEWRITDGRGFCFFFKKKKRLRISLLPLLVTSDGPLRRWAILMLLETLEINWRRSPPKERCHVNRQTVCRLTPGELQDASGAWADPARLVLHQKPPNINSLAIAIMSRWPP
jgi:hypothetical protein